MSFLVSAKRPRRWPDVPGLPDKVPVVINNFNRLSTTRRLCEYLEGVPRARAILVDNASTYQPLLEWYGRCGREVYRLTENRGQMAPWDTGIIASLDSPYYISTDSDLDLTNCPTDFIEALHDGLRRFPDRIKVGLSLEIDDLPNTRLAQIVRRDQEKHWKYASGGSYFAAPVDTTLAIYRHDQGFDTGPALRTARPYTARHMPWYVQEGQVDEEEAYYLAQARLDVSSTTRLVRAVGLR